MSNSEKIFIILPVHNRRKITERFIKCLVKQTWKKFQIILIDDGSIDGTADMVRNYFSNVIVIEGTGNWWWAGCLQRGINWLKNDNVGIDDLVLIINDDVVISPDFLSNGVAYLKAKKKTLLLAQILDETTKEPVESGVTADLSKYTFKIADNGEVINCLSTRGLLLKFNDILEIGDFFPTLLPHYGSDYEYTIRAYKKGFHLTTNSSFYLELDRDETGIQELCDIGGVIDCFRNVFSKRYVPNPIYRSTFIILISPIKRIPILIAPVWKNVFRVILKQVKNDTILLLAKVRKKLSV